MRLVVLPGVFRPLSDSRLLAACARQAVRPGDRVLDLCTGSGLVAVSAALNDARVTAVDVSRRAAVNARLNGRLNGSESGRCAVTCSARSEVSAST